MVGLVMANVTVLCLAMAMELITRQHLSFMYVMDPLIKVKFIS